jgi:formate hydrogenlyase subunit 4
MPKWTEFSMTLMIIAMGFAMFAVGGEVPADIPEEEQTVARQVRPAPVLGSAGSAVFEHAGD